MTGSRLNTKILIMTNNRQYRNEKNNDMLEIKEPTSERSTPPFSTLKNIDRDQKI